MTTPQDTRNLALFCDFENVALGVREAKYDKFDIGLVLERLLLKGSIVVKKAYCDWDRYKDFKGGMHEASFELIEIPHVRMSGKNSADIRMVVDALDLCYTKSHVDTFVIISGDSDFSPLVSKLRENNKTVIAVGVKNSTSNLLIANCDEFIFYDDLVREQRGKTKRPEKKPARSRSAPAAAAAVATPAAAEEKNKKQEAFDLVLATTEALAGERVVAAHAGLHFLVQANDVARILADEHRPVLVGDRRGDGAVVARAADLFLGFTPADEAAFGFDAYQRAVERCDAAEVGDVLLFFGNRDVQPGGADGFDLHNLNRISRPRPSRGSRRTSRRVPGTAGCAPPPLRAAG